MGYAENLALGHGLVWNPGGERVEGYTNLLWVLAMAMLHLLPLGKATIRLAVLVTSARLLVAHIFYVRSIAEEVSGGSRFAGLCAVVLPAFYFSLNTWALQGMEVGLLALLVSIAVWHATRSRRVHRVSPLIYLALGTCLLVRPDLGVLFLVVWGFLIVADGPRRRTHLLYGLVSLALFVGSQTLFRLLY